MTAKKKGKLPSIVAANKDALIIGQDKLMCGKPRGQFHDHYLRIQRGDCGCVFKYQTPDNVPDTNVTCEHGNKIIVYTDKPNTITCEKKPVLVRAMKWTGENKYEILKFASPDATYNDRDGMRILISEGTLICNVGDYVIEDRGFYPCKPDVFKENYGTAKSPKAKAKSKTKGKGKGKK